jgi:hypothetical protein
VLENAAELARPPRKGPPGASVSRDHTPPEEIARQYCLEAGIQDEVVRAKILEFAGWIDACFDGSAEKGRFADLASALDRLRRYAKRTGQRRVARPPAQVVKDRAAFLDFLKAMHTRLDAIFGPPARRPVPPGYI